MTTHTTRTVQSRLPKEATMESTTKPTSPAEAAPAATPAEKPAETTEARRARLRGAAKNATAKQAEAAARKVASSGKGDTAKPAAAPAAEIHPLDRKAPRFGHGEFQVKQTIVLKRAGKTLTIAHESDQLMAIDAIAEAVKAGHVSREDVAKGNVFTVIGRYMWRLD